jgi:hypothetical protein
MRMTGSRDKTEKTLINDGMVKELFVARIVGSIQDCYPMLELGIRAILRSSNNVAR